MSELSDVDIKALLENSVITRQEMEAERSAGGLYGKWIPRTLVDAYAERTPREFLVDGLLPRPSLSILFGGPGSLKSMVLADMAMCIASGKPWLEPMPTGSMQPGVTLQTKQANVLWIDFDNGPLSCDERFEAIGRGHNVPPDAPIHYVSMPDPWLDASDRTIVVDLSLYIQHFKYGLVIIDNLGLISGDTEENSGEMAKVMGMLRWLAETARAAVIVIHHQRKSNGVGDSGIAKGETLRGHSSINAALDLALLVDRKEGADDITIIPTKVRGYRQYSSIGAIFTYEHKPGTKDLHLARFYSKVSESSEEIINAAIKANLKAASRELGACSGKELVDWVRDHLAALPGGKAPGINKVRGLLKAMVDDGVMMESGSRKERTYKAF